MLYRTQDTPCIPCVCDACVMFDVLCSMLVCVCVFRTQAHRLCRIAVDKSLYVYIVCAYIFQERVCVRARGFMYVVCVRIYIRIYIHACHVGRGDSLFFCCLDTHMASDSLCIHMWNKLARTRILFI